MLYAYMNASKTESMRVDATLVGTASVAKVLSPEELADLTMRRLRAEIVDKFGTVKNFAPHLTSIKYEGLNDNLAGRSEMRLNVLYECLAVLELDQLEFTRRVTQDAASSRLG